MIVKAARHFHMLRASVQVGKIVVKGGAHRIGGLGFKGLKDHSVRFIEIVKTFFFQSN